MGIRWYGWSITVDEIALARTDPWGVVRIADERHDTRGWTNAYLDKAWRPMQHLFSDPRCEQTSCPRPAYSLVAGDVSYPYGYAGGHWPYIRVLRPSQVRLIGNDLDEVSEPDVRTYCASWDRGEDFEYLMHYLGEAKEFVQDAASRGHGTVYVIR